ncbi:MAG: hypothetical protein DBY09_00140 [Selenomonadales bacterium]|nr:MAG: hypothetical protein DBY09_00140 [Selenomonadales bacterium]
MAGSRREPATARALKKRGRLRAGAKRLPGPGFARPGGPSGRRSRPPFFKRPRARPKALLWAGRRAAGIIPNIF